MASSDTDDDIIISSALIASTLYQRCKRNSWARKQTIDQSQLGDRARNCRRIETVSSWQFSCSTLQKLDNSRCQTGNFVEQQKNTTKLIEFVACPTWPYSTKDKSFSTCSSAYAGTAADMLLTPGLKSYLGTATGMAANALTAIK